MDHLFNGNVISNVNDVSLILSKCKDQLTEYQITINNGRIDITTHRFELVLFKDGVPLDLVALTSIGSLMLQQSTCSNSETKTLVGKALSQLLNPKHDDFDMYLSYLMFTFSECFSPNDLLLFDNAPRESKVAYVLESLPMLSRTEDDIKTVWNLKNEVDSLTYIEALKSCIDNGCKKFYSELYGSITGEKVDVPSWIEYSDDDIMTLYRIIGDIRIVKEYLTYNWTPTKLETFRGYVDLNPEINPVIKELIVVNGMPANDSILEWSHKINWNGANWNGIVGLPSSIRYGTSTKAEDFFISRNTAHYQNVKIINKLGDSDD